MRLETFFEKFELFADAPDAVTKMRELVLELAVRGALTEQLNSDLNDASWHALTAKLNTRDNGNSLADLPFDIPHTWHWVTLNDLGQTKPRNDVPDTTTASFVPMALIPAEFGKRVQHELRKWNEIKKGYTHFADGDVAMAKITPCYENGKSAVIKQLIGGIGAGTTELHVFRPISGVIQTQYVLIYLKSRGFIERGVPRMTGSAGQKRVPHDYFANSPFPLPPLAEQKRIVAKVDELMALCDRLEAQQQERDTRHVALARASLSRFAEAPTPANLDFLFQKSYPITPADLRKTILTLAVQGKLVPQDPGDEPAGASLSRLGLNSTSENKKGSDEFDDSLPASWTRVRFEDIALTAGGVTLGRKLGDRKTVTLPYLRVANVKRGEIDLCIIKEVSIAEDEVERYALRENDLLMTEGGDWDKVGRAAIWKGQISTCLHQNHVFRSRMRSDEIKPVWFERYFNSPDGRRYFESAAKQTTNLASINMRQVRGCPVPFPPLAEQSRIVAKVDQLMVLVDRLEMQLSEAKIKSAALLDAVIRELLNPTAELIDLASYRAAVGCYAISKMQRKRYFGRTAAMKVLYLAQAHLGLELGLKPMREAAGPFDSWLYRFEEQGEREAWFKVVDDKKKIEYRAGRAIAEQSAQAERAFTAGQRKEFDRLLALFSDRTTEEAEIIATLFAAWNDFLIDGHEPSDDEIVHEVRENWHEKKGRFTPALLRKWLGWLRQNDLVPQGRLPRTAHQTKLLLN